MISLYVLWSKTAGSNAPTDAGLSIELPAAVLASVNEGIADPGLFPKLTRLAIRQFLAELEIGAEVVLSDSEGRPTLSLATEVNIVELELSKRSYNCLKDASIRTLDDLLTWSSERLFELPNFGRKSLTEIIGVLRQLGYPHFCREPEDESIEETSPVSLESGDPAGSLKMRISELGLSVRSFNCLKAASINTLGQLLGRTPEQLLRLPNFGQKCMSEIREVVQRLGYGGMLGQELLSPDEPVAKETTSIVAQNQVVRKGIVGHRGSAPLACLLLLRELPVPNSLAEHLEANGWYSLADLAVHSVESIAKFSALPTEEKQQLENLLCVLSLRLPIEIPEWFIYETQALRNAFGAELNDLKTSLANGRIPSEFWRSSRSLRSLNQELAELIPRSYDDRKRRIVCELLGLTGSDPLTLEETARTQNPLMTRERVRQIARPVTDALESRGRRLAGLLKAMAVLNQLAPWHAKGAQESLLESGILDAPLTVATIFDLAKRSGINHSIVLEGDFIVDTTTAELLRAVSQAAAKLSSHWGVADWKEIQEQFPEVATSPIKMNLQGAVWLDEEQRYFVLPNRENSLANRLVHILTVAPKLSLRDAYKGAFRDVRMDANRLPEKLFAAFCSIWTWCSVEDGEVSARPDLPSCEASADDLLVLLLREIGHPVRRRELTSRALEQGLQIDVVIRALTYGNVISAANGYFAVVGDRSLEEFANRDAAPTSETIDPTEATDDGEVVPDHRGKDFVRSLMLAVEARAQDIGLTAPWSVSELRFAQCDRDRLLAWGGIADWEFLYDADKYRRIGSELVRSRTALGLAFLLFASEAVRRFGDSGSVWPAIEAALGEKQRALFLVRSGLPKLILRESVESACRAFGLRHGFEDVGQQVWVRTLTLQSGLLCSQIPQLTEILECPLQLQPLPIRILLDSEDPNASDSFRASWKLLQEIRRGAVTHDSALERVRSDSWLSVFPAQDLLALSSAPRPVEFRSPAERDTTEEAYRYFLDPTLQWDSTEAYLEYSVNSIPPPWRESAALIFLCEDPFRRERIPIEKDAWKLPNGPFRVSLTRRAEPGFSFKLMQGKEEVFADWMYAGLSTDVPFTFFRKSGALVPVADDVPQTEDLTLLHRMDIQISGFDAQLTYRLVLNGSFRLTRIPAGAVRGIQLLGPGQEVIWSLPITESIQKEEEGPALDICGGSWGKSVDVTLPELPFKVDRLRLNSGEVLPVKYSNGRASVPLSPSLSRGVSAYAQGLVGRNIRSSRVRLHHVGADHGSAIEMNGRWHPIDGSDPLDASTMRTRRFLAKLKWTMGEDKDACWMEGSRTLNGVRRNGTLLAGMHGLGESLLIVRGTYNRSQIEVRVASAITDGGFWHSVQQEGNGTWSAHLPFDGPLEDRHALWMWGSGSSLPRQVAHSGIEKTGFTIRWSTHPNELVFGWAFSFDGARVGSVVRPEMLKDLPNHEKNVPWSQLAVWLRWWHVPVLHADIKAAIAHRAWEHPVETLKAWLLPTTGSSGLIFDELRDEAWAAAARELLWEWRPNPTQAVQLAKSLGILTGDIAKDSQVPPPVEAVGLLARMNPILLADVTSKCLPATYDYPKSSLAVILGMILQTLNPNAAEKSFRLDDYCERYSKSESRLDGRFISTSLVGAARSLLHGHPQDSHNLKIAFHQPGLRELISTALLREIFERWQGGSDN